MVDEIDTNSKIVGGVAIGIIAVMVSMENMSANIPVHYSN